MSRRPVIALSASSTVIRDAPRVRLNAAYTSAIELAGGVPLIVPPLEDAAAAADVLSCARALVLTGGEDVDPARYGQPPHARLGAVHARRDATELALVTAARERRLPTLAICRGIQLLNVALGGTLVQDIAAERPLALDHDPGGGRGVRVHEVRVVPGSALARALGDTEIRVNSIHHQAIDRLGEGLRPTAHAPDGLIEGVEGASSAWWVMGVQWHPEELVAAAEEWDRSLFRALIERTRGG